VMQKADTKSAFRERPARESGRTSPGRLDT
jgi:hypothetical protein